jgi:putative transposase
MSRNYKFRDNSKLYFITYTVINWIDVFIRKPYMDILVESWKYCQQKKGLEIYSWVIMPSHVHLIIGTNKNPLDNIVRDMKSFTSTQLKKTIRGYLGESRNTWMLNMMRDAGMKNSNNNDWQFWQQHNMPLEIDSNEMFYRVMNYIHRNPVKAGFVRHEKDWLYSSAGDFHGQKGLIDLSFI